MKQMHLQNGQKKDCLPKLNGRKLRHGMKKISQKLFILGVINLLLATMPIFLNHINGVHLYWVLIHHGKSHYGCYQMIGDVWEWTCSEYVLYPGFKSRFEEYTDKWAINQKVLRGGCFATSAKQIRNSYRNYYKPHERIPFAGFRCVKDELNLPLNWILVKYVLVLLILQKNKK